jgi:hypothetical protein
LYIQSFVMQKVDLFRGHEICLKNIHNTLHISHQNTKLTRNHIA